MPQGATVTQGAAVTQGQRTPRGGGQMGADVVAIL